MHDEFLKNIEDDVLNRVCFERGIDYTNVSWQEKLNDLKVWITISNLKNVEHSLCLVSRVFDYDLKAYNENENLTQYEILKWCPQEIYYYAK